MERLPSFSIAPITPDSPPCNATAKWTANAGFHGRVHTPAVPHALSMDRLPVAIVSVTTLPTLSAVTLFLENDSWDTECYEDVTGKTRFP